MKEILEEPKPHFAPLIHATPLDNPLSEDERGPHALDFLKANGINSIEPPIRASDYREGVQDPFYYYLRCRLGIVRNTVRAIGALDTGSLYHTWMAAHRSPSKAPDPSRLQAGDKAVDSEVARLYGAAEEAATESGVLPGGIKLEEYMVDLEKESSLAISMGHLTVELMPLINEAYPEIEVLAVEKLLAADLPTEVGKHPCVCRVDALLVDHRRKECWIEDHKSTGADPRIRASSCSFEFPVRLYRLIVEANAGLLRLPYPLVGFRHNIIQKPGIRQKQHETREEFLHRYRCWLTSTEEYTNLEAGRRAKNEYPYLCSFLRFYEPTYSHEFLIQLREAYSLATRAPYPDNFPRVSCANHFGNALHDLHPFYAYGPKKWPDLLASGQYTAGVFRDYETLKEIL